MATTTITIQVREDSHQFRGVISHVAVEGDGSPEHFQSAVHAAMREAGINLCMDFRIRGARRVSVEKRQLEFVEPKAA